MTSPSYPPLAQHAATDMLRVGRRRRTVLFSVLAVIVVLAFIAIAAIARLNGNLTVVQLSAGQDFESSLSGANVQVGTEPLNVLVLGSDGRDAGEGRFGDDDGTRRSDSMMLVHIAGNNERIDAVQIPRDTLVTMPACQDVGHGAFAGGYGLVNVAYNYGEHCSVLAVEALTGVDIDHVVSLNFDGFETVVDAVGGIQVCLDEPIRDGHSMLDLPAGQQELGGQDALALARVRYVIGDGSDISRLENQQMVMSAIVQRATATEVLARPDRLYGLVDAITSSLTVDEGLNSVTRLAGLAMRINAVGMENITFVTMPWAQAVSDPNRIDPAPEAQLVWDALIADEPINLAPAEDEDADMVEDPETGMIAEATPAPDDFTDGFTDAESTADQIEATARTADAAICG
ncbi:LCP family protein [Microbacterium amylolyticum]|uniref:LCP family protein required for cell wall assembly n=1 Tax=Microbacterium amylolyticum TaxID=936337 RepID=A0ABS4ZJ83_9MICO|nr:LCP family protein [Microbacterium amylolyticum]MBP2437331.1 LCP family protein required for cell wall assembly [Microbacterium amylolyticum]